MFELEVDHDRPSPADLSIEIRDQFKNIEGTVKGISVMPWEEHCTECAMPKCYETCDLYEPRKDGKCRRFIGGIVPINTVSNVQNHIVRIAFKRWGQLLAYANLHMIPITRAKRIERGIFSVDKFISRIPDGNISILGRRSLSARVVRKIKHLISDKGYFRSKKADRPDYFLVELYNPNRFTVNISLKIYNRKPVKHGISFQKLLKARTGFNRYKIGFEDIASKIDINHAIGIAFNPNILEKSDEGLCLYFGLLTFVWDTAHATSTVSSASKSGSESKQKYIKVVAWDLDNTIWDGVLVEDGADKLKLKPGIIDIIEQLDKRGILNTVVSKNNESDALAQLKTVGLDKYILHPQIGWGQKGQYLKTLVNQFNVGEDTFAFIDDSPFERDEALNLNPTIRAYDAVLYDTLLELPEFNPPVSTDSHHRREFYRFEQDRGKALSSFAGEYLSFLKECQIKLSIYAPQHSNIDRIHELVQRTNQLNFSGNRYTRGEIEKILADPGYETFIMDCEDKYGQYGTIGFAIVNKQAAQLIDLMFSCRVQAKRIEHAFLSFLLDRYKTEGFKTFTALYHPTDRNQQAGEVFNDWKFKNVGREGNLDTFEFDLINPIPNDEVINVLWNGETCPA